MNDIAAKEYSDTKECIDTKKCIDKEGMQLLINDRHAKHLQGLRVRGQQRMCANYRLLALLTCLCLAFGLVHARSLLHGWGYIRYRHIQKEVQRHAERETPELQLLLTVRTVLERRAFLVNGEQLRLGVARW